VIGVTVLRSPRPCKFVVDSDPCHALAIYTVQLADCPVCLDSLGFLFCTGHSPCLDHGAVLRAEEFTAALGAGEPGDGKDITVARISAVYREVS
jgi:hypothetical protein